MKFELKIQHFSYIRQIISESQAWLKMRALPEVIIRCGNRNLISARQNAKEAFEVSAKGNVQRGRTNIQRTLKKEIAVISTHQ